MEQQSENLLAATEAALRESAANFRNVVETIGDLIVVATPDGRVLFANRAFKSKLGYDEADLAHMHLLEAHPPDKRKEAEEIFGAMFRGERETCPLPLQTKSGALLPVETRVWFGQWNGNPCLFGLIKDLTSEVEAQQRLESIFRASPALMALSDIPGQHFREINDAFLKTIGYSRDEIIGKTSDELNLFPQREAQQAAAAELLAQGRLTDHELQVRCKDGTLVDGIFSGEIINLQGKHYLLTVMVNITERKRALEALRTSEEKYRGIFDESVAAIYTFDNHKHFLDSNQAGLELLGYARAELLCMSVADVDADPVVVLPAHTQLLTGGRLINYEHRLRRKDGQVITVLNNSRPLTDERGEIVGMLSTLLDITDRKRNEEALRASEERYATILKTAMDGFWMSDLQGRLLQVNETYCRMSGYSETELLRMNISDLECVESPAEVQASIHKIIEQGQYRLEGRHRRKDGSFMDVEVSVQYRAADGGRLASFIRDITAQKTAAAERERLSTAIEQAAETIMITDPTGAILYANPAFETITGYTRAEALGKNPRLLKSGKHDTAFYAEMWATLKSGRVWKGRIINRRKDGTLFDEEATISPVLDAAGTLVNYVAVKRDVTREVALEQQNRQAAKMEAVGRLAGGVAHDFNNKLQIILIGTEALRKQLKDQPAYHSDLADILTAAQHSADLTRQLLAFSRQQTSKPVIMDLNEAIANSLKMLRRLMGENIQLHFTQHSSLGRVLMDPGQLDQILVNLTVNARDALEGKGQIFIETKQLALTAALALANLEPLPPGNYVVLTFRDDGPGMSAEILEHIFEPFFTTKGQGQGTGLGLATVYGIVQQNHGAITVKSAPQRGATFTIYLPEADSAAAAEAEEQAAPAPGGNETVLVVEDDEPVLNMVRRTLANHGYDVLTADAPRDALQLLQVRKAPVHLLLTDVIMPGMSGKALAEQVAKLRPATRLLFMSGYTADILKEQGQMAELPFVLQKPFNTSKLLQAVRDALDAPPPAQ